MTMKTLEQLSEELTVSYAALSSFVEQMGDIEKDIYESQAALTDARNKILRDYDAKSLGCNEAQRESVLQNYTLIERQTLAEVEVGKLELRPLLEIARLRVEAVKAQLRLLEIQATGLKEPGRKEIISNG
jgi:hypothetical protein